VPTFQWNARITKPAGVIRDQYDEVNLISDFDGHNEEICDRWIQSLAKW